MNELLTAPGTIEKTEPGLPAPVVSPPEDDSRCDTIPPLPRASSLSSSLLALLVRAARALFLVSLAGLGLALLVSVLLPGIFIALALLLVALSPVLVMGLFILLSEEVGIPRER